MSMNYDEEIESAWKELCADPSGFLKKRDTLEDFIIECKHSVLTEPLFNAVQGEESIRTGRHRKKLPDSGLIDNLYVALLAIAAMANSGGGIVLFGVASAEKDATPGDNSPLAERGMTGDSLKKKFFKRETGIRLGKAALIVGIDHEMTQKESGPVDGHSDKYIQKLFGIGSAFLGKHKLYEMQTWHTIDLKDAEDANSYPTVECREAMKIKWCRELNSDLVKHRFLTIKDESGGLERTILAFKVEKREFPVYYIEQPLNKNSNKVATPYKVPFRFPNKNIVVGLERIEHLELILGRLPRYRTYLENQSLIRSLDQSRPLPAGSPTPEELVTQRKAILKEALEAKYRQLQMCFADRFNIGSFEFCLRPGSDLANGLYKDLWVFASQPLTLQMFTELVGAHLKAGLSKTELEGASQLIISPVRSRRWNDYKELSLDRLRKSITETMKSSYGKLTSSCAQCTIASCWNRIVKQDVSESLNTPGRTMVNVVWEEDTERERIRAVISI